MALNNKNKPVFGTIPLNGSKGFSDASTAHTYNSNTNLEVVLTGEQKGVICDSLFIVSNDSVARLVAVYLRQGAVLKLLRIVNVPANSGTDGTVLPVDVFSNSNCPHLPINNQGKRFVRLLLGEEIVAGILSVPSAGKFITLIGLATIIDQSA